MQLARKRPAAHRQRRNRSYSIRPSTVNIRSRCWPAGTRSSFSLSLSPRPLYLRINRSLLSSRLLSRDSVHSRTRVHSKTRAGLSERLAAGAIAAGALAQQALLPSRRSCPAGALAQQALLPSRRSCPAGALAQQALSRGRACRAAEMQAVARRAFAAEGWPRIPSAGRLRRAVW